MDNNQGQSKATLKKKEKIKISSQLRFHSLICPIKGAKAHFLKSGPFGSGFIGLINKRHYISASGKIVDIIPKLDYLKKYKNINKEIKYEIGMEFKEKSIIYLWVNGPVEGGPISGQRREIL